MKTGFPLLHFSFHHMNGPIFDDVISDISVVSRKSTRTISDSIEISSPVKYEMVRVVSLGATEIFEITRF